LLGRRRKADVRRVGCCRRNLTAPFRLKSVSVAAPSCPAL
jgi:hypothetical protein